MGTLKLVRIFLVGITWQLIFSFPLTKAIPAAGQTPQSPPPDIPRLVSDMSWNELQASRHPAHYYQYLERTISPGSSQTSLEITASGGTVDRLVEVDGSPPTQQQINQNQSLLKRLTTDEGLRRSRLKDQRSDRDRRDNVIRDLPKAFIYSYKGKDKDGLIRLTFKPDPNFHPSSRQALILEGMAGELWVNPSSQRLAKVDGTLISDVTIGWGFFARLYKGGRFLLEQTRGPDGTWHQRKLSVDFDGSEFLIKGIHIHMKQIRCCFTEVPNNLTVPEAVRMCLKSPLPPHWQADLEAAQHSSKFN